MLSVPRDLLVPSFSFHGQTYVNQKINYAYTVGSLYGKSSTAGDELALAVVKHALDGIQINDFIDLNFVTFTKVVSELGCVYINVDHHYLIPPDTGVSAIDLNPGYQPLCYNGALAYVRYRHADSTFARDARQQDFLRQAKDQLGVSGLLSHYQQVLNGLGNSIATSAQLRSPLARRPARQPGDRHRWADRSARSASPTTRSRYRPRKASRPTRPPRRASSAA